MNLDLIKLAQEQTGTETGLKQQVIEALRRFMTPRSRSTFMTSG